MNPKSALKQQALGTGPAEGSRQPFPATACLLTAWEREEPGGPGLFGKGLVTGLVRWCPSLCSKTSRLAKGAKRREGKGSLLNMEGEDAECFSSTEGWPVCFGKKPEGGREGQRSGGGALNEAFSSKGKTSPYLHSCAT